MRRTDQRRDAVFACYQRDVTGRPLEELVAGSRAFTRALVTGVQEHRDQIDEVIARHSKGWDLARIAPLDLNLMRVALFEIEYGEAPTEVAIDRGGGDRQGVLRGRCSGLRQRHPWRRGARGSQMSRLREISERLRVIAAELDQDLDGEQHAAELAAGGRRALSRGGRGGEPATAGGRGLVGAQKFPR